MDILCNACKNNIKTKNISLCPNCSSILCDGCDNLNGGICPHCYTSLSRLS